MKNKIILIAAILFIFIPFFDAKASHKILSLNLTPNKIGAGATKNYTLSFANKGPDPIYRIRLEAPLGFNLTGSLNCPADKNLSDSFNWSQRYEKSSLTCQTSANENNPNLIKQNETIAISFQATAPTPSQSAEYAWRFISEDRISLAQITNDSLKILLDTEPPKATNIIIKDQNNNGKIDTATIIFDEAIISSSFKASDFIIGGTRADLINSLSANSFDVILNSNSEIDSTEAEDVTYSAPKGGTDLFGISLLDFSTSAISETDNIAPKIAYHELDKEPVGATKTNLKIIFSEGIDPEKPPEIVIKGLKTDPYKVENIACQGLICSGSFTLKSENEEKQASIFISNAADLFGNQIIPNSFVGNFLADTLAPAASLSNLPFSVTTSRKANIIAGGKDIVYFKYKLDGGLYSDPISTAAPIYLSNLGQGNHTIYVIGQDKSLNWQTDPTTYTWFVDIPRNAATSKGSNFAQTPVIIEEIITQDINTQGILEQERQNNQANETLEKTINESQQIAEPISAKSSEIKEKSPTQELKQITEDAKKIFERKIDTKSALADIAAVKKTYAAYTLKLIKGVKSISSSAVDAITYFISQGTQSTKSLGAGERAGVINSYKSAFGKLPETRSQWSDAIKISNGRWPSERNSKIEEKAKKDFEIIYKRPADMSNPHDNAAVTVMSYGLRPKNRNLNSEKAAIKTFKHIYGHNPSQATEWDKARAIAYSGASR